MNTLWESFNLSIVAELVELVVPLLSTSPYSPDTRHVPVSLKEIVVRLFLDVESDLLSGL